MSGSSAKTFHTQFKSFCYHIEQDAKKLREIADSKPYDDIDKGTAADLTYLKSLNDDVDRMEQNSDGMMANMNKKGQVTMQELYKKCKSLHEISEAMMSNLENQMVDFGYKGENSRRIVRQVDNKENNSDENMNTSAVHMSGGNRSFDENCTHENNFEELFIDPTLLETSVVDGDVYSVVGEGVEKEDENAAEAMVVTEDDIDVASTEMDGTEMLVTMNDFKKRESEIGEEKKNDEQEDMKDTQVSPARLSIFKADAPRTPSLADMKLSAATCGAIQFDISPDSSDDDGRMSPLEKKLIGSETPISPAHMEKSIFLDTPGCSNRNIVTNANADSTCTPSNPNLLKKTASVGNDTPPTPELVNDFATCSLQEVTCSLHPAVMAFLDGGIGDTEIVGKDKKSASCASIASQSSTKSMSPTAELDSTPPEVPASKAIKDVYDSDEDEEGDGGIKTKILRSRRNTDGKAAENWIPFIESLEWEGAPMSLKVQISSPEILNAGIESLNKFIFTHQNKKDESFTIEEMATIVSAHIKSVSVNVFALSLVHLKRLDLGMENSIRVYKVKRFY